MALNLSGVFGDIGNLAGSVSGNDILQSLLAGAAGTVVLSGLKSQEGLDAIDPLHIIHKPATPTAPATTAVISGAGVITMSKFLALTLDQQKMFEALNYSVVPG
jgi:hypothetical protein